ncbi:NAD(P)/FAD-dependent oxidoreductase [Gloeothece verrucosa]|uniref:Lycopene beta and epsilon cyclase n=1 Tax=Gloeothece verrucosa (strain PCC 7822) TaxID=497965 RepID=E0UL61_GLOV7|nr:tryptophan 7-halogenase [Gloeothece verrucosa]ADN17691.1 Lycopene beta and epsilon cyclase [Gloeothece verrucosa PCC 7822]
MEPNQFSNYDVIIMGAGLAGLCQARHLKLNIPNIKIALIDFRPEDRDPVKDLKIGESTVEIAALFLSKDLGLHEYLIENHLPKHGLNFHWPKNPQKTDTINDYFHIWTNRNLPLPSFQINRSKLERDLLKMNKEMGITFIQGRVIDVELTAGEALNIVKVKIGETYQELSAKHLVDAAGRKFIIGQKTDNLLFGPENLLGLNNGSAWMRIKNVDRTIFHSGYDPLNSSASHYYGTNHFFGEGYWIWMIPIDKDPMEVSIGIVHHHHKLPGELIKNPEKFLEFLKANQTVLYNFIQSGEQEDFNYWPRIAHRSKMMFSPDNWYVIGDAAYILDAFYSYGSSTIAIAVESVTEIIRAKLAQEPDAEQKRAAYNDFNLSFAHSVNTLYRGHDNQLGNASVMSWRVYFEYMWWFGLQVPMYIGKWHLDLTYIPIFLKALNGSIDSLMLDLCKQFNQLAEEKANIGLMDFYRTEQFIWQYYPLKHYDDFVENAKYEPRRCNVFAGLKSTCFYAAIWYITFQVKAFGLKKLFTLKNLKHVVKLLALSLQGAIGELIYKSKIRGLPSNSEIEQMRQDFKTYRYQPQLQPWTVKSKETLEVSQENSAKIPALSQN